MSSSLRITSNGTISEEGRSVGKYNMPPLGIFRRGRSASPSPAPQTPPPTLTQSVNNEPSSTPSRGLFRGLGSSRHGTNNVQEQNSKGELISDVNIPIKSIGEDERELEFLDVFNNLSQEKEDARDEIQQKVKESNELSMSNRSLQSQVSDLESKLQQLSKEAEQREQEENDRPPITPQSGKVRPSQKKPREAKVFTFDSPNNSKERSEALERIKSKLEMHHESNSEINNRVQRIRDKYAKRREEIDEMSETSSVVSAGTYKSHITSPMSSPRHHMVEVKKLERNFDKELQKNVRLEESIKRVLGEKETAERLLEQQKLSSEKIIEELNVEIDELKSQLAKEKAMLVQSEKAMADLQNKNNFDEVNDLKSQIRQQSTEMNQLKSEITVKERQIHKLNEENYPNINEDRNPETEEKADVAKLKMRLEQEMDKVEILQASVAGKEAKINQLQDDSAKMHDNQALLPEYNADQEQHGAEVNRLTGELDKKNEELRQHAEEIKKCKKDLAELELDFVSAQEKSARYFQEMEDMNEKYDAEVERNGNNQIKKSSGKEAELLKQLDKARSELKALKQNLSMKEEELGVIQNEKDKSFTKLETIEQDMMVIQRKNSMTFEELEDLKEKYDHEKQEKANLKEQLDKFSPEEILADAKKENQKALRSKDSEIHDLKKHLTDANVAKTEIELKLMEVMNDVISSQSTRDVMKGQLEARLEEENDKASHLETLIGGKEEEMGRMRNEFNELRIQMEKETDLKRNEISDLNGEVVEKSSQLSSRDREFLQLKAKMDDMRLQHDTEISKLRREIDDFGSNETEMQKITLRNQDLEREVESLKHEVHRLHMNKGEDILSPDSSGRILRTRNEQLKEEVEKLQRKLRRMRRNVTRIEI